MKADLDFVKKVLPDTYTVKPSKTKGSIHCVSPTGVFKGSDDEDDEHWGYIMKAIKKYFGKRFSEVYHHTCSNHVNFTICLGNVIVNGRNH